MQHTAGFAPGWLRAQIHDSINQLKTDPRFSNEAVSFSETEEQVSHSTLFRRADEVEEETLAATSGPNLAIEA